MPTRPLAAELVLDEHALDSAHLDLFATLARLGHLAPDAFAPAFHDCIAAMERDFRAEEALMEGLDFSPLVAHREQHARVLGGLHHAAAALVQGDAAPARKAVALLEKWLPLHIGTMDRALVVACRRRQAQPAT